VENVYIILQQIYIYSENYAQNFARIAGVLWEILQKYISVSFSGHKNDKLLYI